MKSRLHILFSALDAFLFEKNLETHSGPHIRDFIDLKRWMIIVVFALTPCLIMAIFNSGVQAFVYSATDLSVIQEYYASSCSFTRYLDFVFRQGHFLPILGRGLKIVLPLLLISYGVGGLWEALFAVIRGHEISEGFLVTGMLYALVLPSTLPYWMAALGISFAVIIGKELFGGTGMNILNPALVGRCFLFFTFPAQMTGTVWAGDSTQYIAENISRINQTAGLSALDGISQTSSLSYFNISTSIKRVHVDALVSYLKKNNELSSPMERAWHRWQKMYGVTTPFSDLSAQELERFFTSAPVLSGLGMGSDVFVSAMQFAKVKMGEGIWSNGNLFFGNMLGSLGETSAAACLLGALILLFTGVASGHVMCSMGLGAWLTALCFQIGSHYLGADEGIWNPAKFDFPAYKHLIMGGLAFGLIFMATEPVTSPNRPVAKWIYGLLIGFMVIFIRLINPAFPEGVMLAILFGNVFAPLLDYLVLKFYIKRHSVYAKR